MLSKLVKMHFSERLSNMGGSRCCHKTLIGEEKTHEEVQKNDDSAVKRLKYLIMINHINVIVNSQLTA